MKLNKLFNSYKNKIRKKAFKAVVKSKSITELYYLSKPSGFQDEQYAVLSGITKNVNDISNIGNFRRAIHRIEKGLITEPFKPVFAESYIIETVKLFKRLCITSEDKSTLLWAEGILNQYFKEAKPTETIKIANDLFLQNITRDDSLQLPSTYKSKLRVKSEITYEEFNKLNLQRRSVRKYEDRPVPRELVEKALQIALLSPSACNRQPFVFHIIDDVEKLNVASRLPNGAITFANNIKMIIFVIGDLSNYFSERDKHLIYIDGSLAAMNFILTLEILGLSSCIINWSDIADNNKKLKNFLKLREWEQCIMTISVGYADPDGGIPSSIKKNLQSIIKYNVNENTN